MASFYSVLGFLSINAFDISEPGSFDIVGTLPLEVASNILRLLPSKDLLIAASVSKTWMRICKSDIKLRKKLRSHLRKMRKARLLTLIRDDRNGRRLEDIPIHRATMTALDNYPAKKDNKINLNFIRSNENVRPRFKPYYLRKSDKSNIFKENVHKICIRM